MTSSRAPRRPPIQPRAEETRARILQKARDAFAEQGFDGASSRDIAREAGVTHSMITYHFGTKDALWREAVRDMFALIDAQVNAPEIYEQDLDPVERFRQQMRRYTRYCAQHPEHARITIAEAIRGGPRLEWMIEEFVKHNHAGFMPQLKTLMEAGILPAVPPESLLYAIVGMAQLPFVLAREAQGALNYDFTQEAAIERHADAILTLLLRRNEA
ncbi:TetR/AcrR family transcriptional regulator [Novosphingobium terrae]|uniref:TetR/AcrR family transcriptional regulator n=1 Tax=Novosphingobium terrae TaxID=2726189 RepID=UPI00197DF981|nr:TetR/AcrR family transcriptional regulator [Novosphingobium terrae]